MTLENNGTSDVVPEIDTSAPAPETPEVAEPESNEEEQQPQEKPEQDDSDKSLKRLQRRIDRVTAARYQAEGEARQLREQLQRLSQQQAQTDEPQQLRAEDIERLATERAAQIAQANETQAKVNSVLEAGRSIKDFDSLCNAVNEEISFYENGRPTAFMEAVLDSDKPHELLAYLGQNPEALEDLHGLSASRLGRRIEAIEREMRAPKVSKAPQPLKPVTPKGAPHGKSESEMTDAEWYRARFKR